MSRLDNFIARMQAQRLLLDDECARLNRLGADFAGPVIELGLGNGRTFDHLRQQLVGRRIVVFERDPRPNERSRPPAADLIVGEIADAAARFVDGHGSIATLVHADLGDGTEVYNEELRGWLPAVCAGLLRSGGRVVTSTELRHQSLQPIAIAAEAARGGYFTYTRS